MALVAIEVAAGEEPAEHLVALLGEVTQREAWIDSAHLQGQSPRGGVEVEVSVDDMGSPSSCDNSAACPVN